MLSHRLRVLAGVLGTGAALALVPAAQADAPPPASNDLVPETSFAATHGGSPGSVALASNGDVLVAAPSAGVIDEYTPAGTLVDSYDGTDSGTAFDAPQAVATDADGNIYVADSGNTRVVKLDSSGAFVAAFDGSDSPGHTLTFPLGIAVHGSTVYVADNADRIETFTTAGAFQSAIGSSGSGNGQLDSPSGLDIGDDGSVYVADRDNQRVEVFAADGSYLRQFGSVGAGPGQFEFPTDVSLDGDGNIFVADSNNHRGQKLTAGGSFLGAFAPLAGPRFEIGVVSDGAMGVWGSEQGTFSSGLTHYAPRAEATTADGVTSTGATLHGIIRPNGTPIAYQFRWHRKGHGTWHALAPHSTGGDFANDLVNDDLAGLAANRDYVFRVRATPTGGDPEISNDIEFHTAAAPAAVVGDIGDSDVSFTGATAHLSVPITGHGGPSTVTLEYLRDGGPEHDVAMHSSDPLTATQRTFAKAIKVKPGAHYTYTIKLENNAGIARSGVREFTTP